MDIRRIRITHLILLLAIIVFIIILAIQITSPSLGYSHLLSLNNKEGFIPAINSRVRPLIRNIRTGVTNRGTALQSGARLYGKKLGLI